MLWLNTSLKNKTTTKCSTAHMYLPMHQKQYLQQTSSAYSSSLNSVKPAQTSKRKNSTDHYTNIKDLDRTYTLSPRPSAILSISNNNTSFPLSSTIVLCFSSSTRSVHHWVSFRRRSSWLTASVGKVCIITGEQFGRGKTEPLPSSINFYPVCMKFVISILFCYPRNIAQAITDCTYLVCHTGM